ncbi:MAG: preprotein translocase subunit YajC [Marinilabiliaceae bacterium]|nr:preprotein translocase subunit YajC [Marinilabiliaceae bacterium]
MFTTFLQVATETTEQTAGSMFTSILPFILIIVVFYFFMIRPQQKRQKEINNFRNALQKGDQIMTTGGLYGKVSEIKDNIVIVEVAEGVKMRFDKSAILSANDQQKQA